MPAIARKPTGKPRRDVEITTGSGNVFADLDLPDPDLYLAKAELARVIRQTVREHGWTQREAAEELGISESDVSELIRGKLRRFSLDRIERYLLSLNYDIEIRVRARGVRRTPARTSVVVESALLPGTAAAPITAKGSRSGKRHIPRPATRRN